MITVIIERHIAPGMTSTYENFAQEIIEATVSAPGFISGESLRGLEDSNARYIIVKMRNQSNWKQWLASKQRRDLVTLVMPLLTSPEKITLLTV